MHSKKNKNKGYGCELLGVCNLGSARGVNETRRDELRSAASSAFSDTAKSGFHASQTVIWMNALLGLTRAWRTISGLLGTKYGMRRASSDGLSTICPNRIIKEQNSAKFPMKRLAVNANFSRHVKTTKGKLLHVDHACTVYLKVLDRARAIDRWIFLGKGHSNKVDNCQTPSELSLALVTSLGQKSRQILLDTDIQAKGTSSKPRDGP